jgi:hypothetical protein
MIYLGKLLTKDDLKAFIYCRDVIVDPFGILYTIFDCTTGKQEVIRQTINSKPMRFDVGSYFVPLHIHPKIFRIGKHLIRWQVQQYSNSVIQQAGEEFEITRPPAYAGEFCISKYAPSTSAYK